MIILGIHEGHNGTACLMKNGEIIAAISEERITRKKNEIGYPKKAIDKCLEITNIKPEEIDIVAASTIEFNMLWMKIKRDSTFNIQDHINEQHKYFKPVLIDKLPAKEILWEYIKEIERKKGIQENYYGFSEMNIDNFSDIELNKKIRIKTITDHLKISPSKIKFIEHHLCHSYFAYYSSPYREDTLIITADGIGDKFNATVSISKNNNIKRIFATDNCQLARIYRYITLLLGMKPGEHEFKVMGLAPYANSKEVEKAYKIFSKIMKVNDLEFEWDEKPRDLYFHFKEKLEGCRFDGIAGAVQKMLEEVFVKWVKNVIKKTGIRTIVFSGGLAMNIKLNMEINNLSEVKKLFVGPSPADESNAIGACYFAMSKHCEEKKTDKKIIIPIKNSYLGPEFTKKDVKKAIDNNKISERYDVLENIDNKFIAKQLKDGKVVGVCRGRMEFGARALGNRSILANPSNNKIIQKINTQIKFRDFWMPFTPSILHERINDYLINPKNLYSPFMTLGFESKPLARKEIIASLHPADFTARPQMVKKDIHPEYYNLIKEFENLTGIGCVLNTSLNLHGLPIVCSPEDAIVVMENSELDMIYFGDILIARK